MAKRALVPEFNLFGHDAPARPVRWPRHCAEGEARGGERHFSLKFETPGHRLRLARSPRAKLAETRARREVGVGLRVGDWLDATFNADLPLKFRPMKAESRVRIRPQGARFWTLKICVEDETPVVHVLEQHHAHTGTTLGIRRGERHGRGIVRLRGSRLGKPFLKSSNRVARGHRNDTDRIDHLVLRVIC